jgi:hypothetical protein
MTEESFDMFDNELMLGPTAIGWFTEDKTKKNSETLKEVMLQHLILQSFMERVLAEENFRATKMDWSRLKFVHKMHLLPLKGVHLGEELFYGIKCINEVRNHYAHKLDYELLENDIQPIRKFFEKMYQNDLGNSQEYQKPIEAIKLFVQIACFLISHKTFFFRKFIKEEFNKKNQSQK